MKKELAIATAFIAITACQSDSSDPVDTIDLSDPVDTIDSSDPVDTIDSSDPVDSTDSSDPVDTTDSSDPVDTIPVTELVLPMPDRSIQAITAEQLQATVTIDGETSVLTESDSVWRGSFNLPTDRELPITISWSFRGIPLATYESTIGPISENNTLMVGPDDYTTTGINFDADADGSSNLQEVINCTDPEDAANIDVVIPRLSEGAIIGITGNYGNTWQAHPSTDWCGEMPSVDNLMIDQGPTFADGETGFFWQAVHDGEFLYVIVLTEPTSTATNFGDSTFLSRDDSVHIFVDGDNSKLDTYDGVNDFHIIIPLFKRVVPVTESPDSLVVDSSSDSIFDDQGNIAVTNDAGETVFVPAAEPEDNYIRDIDRRIAFGPLNERLFDNLIFNNTSFREQHIYETRIALDALDITIGQPFGFEIQVDDDADGGDKEARYGWKHPSREPGGEDVNNTVNNPSFMGTVVLE